MVIESPTAITDGVALPQGAFFECEGDCTMVDERCGLINVPDTPVAGATLTICACRIAGRISFKEDYPKGAYEKYPEKKT